MPLNMYYLMQFACLKCVFVREISFFELRFLKMVFLYHFKGGQGDD